MLDDRVLDLADRFSSAAMGEGSWLGALQALADATGSARGQLIGIGNGDAMRFNWINDFAEEHVADFHQNGGTSPATNARVAVALNDAPLQLRWERDYDAVAATFQNGNYYDLVRHYDIPYGCQTKVLCGPDGFVGLAVLRTEQDGRSLARDRALFAAAMPHVRSAVRTQIALEHQGAALIAGAMDEVDAAVFLCRPDGFVERMSQAAERLVQSGSFRIVDRRLQARDASDSAVLQSAVAEHGAGRGLPLDSLVLGGHRPGELPTLVDLCVAGASAGRILPLVMVIVRTGRRWHQASQAILRQFYGLSTAEADVVMRLASGQARAVIAETRGASVETVRAQLKSAFSKLGVSREVEVVSMLGSLLRA